MEFVDQLLRIPEVFRSLPTRTDISVSGPLNEIKKLPITPFGVEDAINFPFFQVVDNHRVRFARWLAWDWRCVPIDL
jgi:hypothetical protein